MRKCGERGGRRSLNLAITTFIKARVADTLVALPIGDAKGVSVPGKVTRIPGAAPDLAGLIYFRGGIEAAIDLGQIWRGVPALNQPTARAVLIESEGVRVVVIFDELLDLLDLDSESIKPEVGGLPGIAGRVEWGGEEMLLFSSQLLFQRLANEASSRE